MRLTNDIMYDALLKKDITFEGTFYAAIRTTGIFCRSTCTARKPKKENVEFFKTPREAMLNGYRPCKICTPLTPLHETPEQIRKLIEDLNTNPLVKLKDSDLRGRGIEPSMLRRWFKKNHGITFHTYHRMLRINGAFKQLSSGIPVTHAAFDSGYDSLSGFSDAYKSVFGTPPSENRSLRVINITRFSTPIGPMFACAVAEGVCLLEFADRRKLPVEFRELTRLLKGRIVYGEHPLFGPLQEQLSEYFKGTRNEFTIPLVTPGTEFQNAVWEKLRLIPYGITASYKKQAVSLGRKEAVRAVANANGCNRISILIPCHRVIGEDGSLTGYGGGLWRKRWLLEFERRHNITAQIPSDAAQPPGVDQRSVVTMVRTPR